MKQYKKPLALWLGRTNHTGSTFSNYQIATRKGDWSPDDGFDGTFISSFCGDDFERVTGIRLDLGELVRVRISIEPRHPGSR